MTTFIQQNPLAALIVFGVIVLGLAVKRSIGLAILLVFAIYLVENLILYILPAKK